MSIGAPPELLVVRDPAADVASLLAQHATRGGTIVLTGGSTPAGPTSGRPSSSPTGAACRSGGATSGVSHPTTTARTTGLAHEHLIRRLRVRPGTHRIRGELPPGVAADEFDQALTGVALDFVLLGLGSDGHMASLFPGSPQLKVRDRRATGGPAGLEPFVHRVTMTLPTIRSAKRIAFLVTGEDKANAVAASFGATSRPRCRPA